MPTFTIDYTDAQYATMRDLFGTMNVPARLIDNTGTVQVTQVNEWGHAILYTVNPDGSGYRKEHLGYNSWEAQRFDGTPYDEDDTL